MNGYNAVLAHAFSMDYLMSDRKKTNIDAISGDPFVRIMNQFLICMLSNEILRFLSEIEIDITTGGH